MPETFSQSDLVIPGTYIDVQTEGLIAAGGVSTGNIGSVGTAENSGWTFGLSTYDEARDKLGEEGADLHLLRAVQLLYANGAGTVYARALDPDSATTEDFSTAFEALIKKDVNILVAPELSTEDALAVLPSVLDTAEQPPHNRDLIGVVGCDATTVDDIVGQVVVNDRLIMVAPGIVTTGEVALSGTYTAAAVAGLLSTLAPEDSPTNKVLSGVMGLDQEFSYADEKTLINGGVLALEESQGVRVVRGVTTEMAENGPYRQITTRRITNTAKEGIRQASRPFIGRLNNERVRGALRAAIDGFLAGMVSDEALIGYALEVTATRPDEIQGKAVVKATIQPTFSIDFVAVTMVLE
jgi:hypothetical protein